MNGQPVPLMTETRTAVVGALKSFSAFFGQSRDQLTFEDVRTYNLFRGKQATSFAP